MTTTMKMGKSIEIDKAGFCDFNNTTGGVWYIEILLIFWYCDYHLNFDIDMSMEKFDKYYRINDLIITITSTITVK